MPIDILITFKIFLKVLSIIGLLVYILFAAIIVRQETLMAHVLEEDFEPFVRLIALIHLALAVAVLLMAIIFLP